MPGVPDEQERKDYNASEQIVVSPHTFNVQLPRKPN